MTESAKIYCYTRCSTCRKALKWLQEHQIEHEVIDIVENPPSKKLLSMAISQIGEIKKLVNTSGLSYRSIGASAFKLLSNDQILCKLASDGKLIKRPFFISKTGDFLLGFKPDYWSQILLN